MSDDFFSKPVLNSPYKEPRRHWELDEQGQPTQRLVEMRRRAEFITPIPKPRKQKGPVQQKQFLFADPEGISTEAQQYDPTPVINDLRAHVGAWRRLPNPNDWYVTPETARLRHGAAAALRRLHAGAGPPAGNQRDTPSEFLDDLRT